MASILPYNDTVLDPGRSLMQGLLSGQQYRQNALNANLLNQQAQMEADQYNRNVAQQEQEKDMQMLAMIAQGLEGIPPQDQQGVYISLLDSAKKMGFDVSDAPQQLDKNTLAQLNMVKGYLFQKSGSPGSPYQFGEGRRVTRTDPYTGEEVQGILTEVRNPNTGEIMPQFTPVQGSFVSTLGETAEQESDRRVNEAGEKEIATLEARAEKLGAVERVKFLSSNRETIASDYDESLSVMEDIDRAIAILNTAGNITGPLVQNLSKFGSNEAQELESILARLGIDRLSNFKGATSEKELATAFRAGASMEQDKKVAIRRLEAQKRRVSSSSDRMYGLLGEANEAIGGDQKPAAQSSSSYPTPKTQAEYDVLKSGDIFIDYIDGKPYRKP